MIIGPHTKENIITAMEQGAMLVFHCYLYGTWNDGSVGVSGVTLEHNGKALHLSRRDIESSDYIYSDDGDLRGCRVPYIRQASELGQDIAEHKDVREEYGGYRSDYAKTWREVYVHKNRPVPRWITEQWDSPAVRYEGGSK